MATIRIAKVSSTMNSSYVLILPFKARKRRYSHPIGSPGKHIMFSWCGVATVAPVQGGTFWPVPDGANFGLGGRKIALTSE